ncbi:MAG: hypothetical protein ACREQ4_11235 [Candidatus Binataceae bacterium]
MSEPERRLLMSVLGCVCFGYAIVSSLVFHARMRQRAARYSDLPLERVVRSRRYPATFWLSGFIGVAGFIVSSWQLTLSLMLMMHGG